MTEDEAKKKWCPFANAHGDSMLRGVTRDTDRNWQHTLCIASECMAWQFDEIEYEDGEPLPIGSIPADPGWEKNGETWCAGAGYPRGGEQRQRWRRALPRTGGCGLVSTPRGE